MLLTYLLTGTTLITFLSLCTYTKTNLFRRTPLDLPIFAFLGSQILATIFSVHPATSIWGYYSRFHGGLLSYITYTTLYYLFISYSHLLDTSIQKNGSFFTRKKFFNYFLQAITLTGGLVAFYGILEHFGIDKHIWIQDVQSRVFSTLGQPNWLSAYLVALLPISLHLFFVTKDNKTRLYWLVLTLLYLLAILYTKSRSGIGTTVIILGLYFAYSLYKTIKLRKAKPLSSLAIFLVPFVVIVATIGTPWTPAPGELRHRLEVGGPILRELEPYLNKLSLSSQFKPLEMDKLPQETQDLIIKRDQGIRVGGSDSFEIRQVVWQGAIDLFKRRPLFGTGVETFGYTYYWTRPIAHNTLSEWDFLYNKAHNEFLNFLSTTGVFGLITYIILLLSMVGVLNKNQNSSKLNIPIILSIIAISITNYFGFSVVILGIFLFLLPALTLYANKDEPVTNLHSPSHVDSSHYMTFTGFISLSCLLTLAIYRIWMADINYSIGKSYLELGYVAQAIKNLEQSTKLSDSEGNYQSILAEAYATAAISLYQKSIAATQSAGMPTVNTLKSQSSIFQTKSAETIVKAISLNPYHLNYLKSKIKIEIILSEIDKKYLESSLQTLNQAITLAPTDPKLVYNLGLVYEQLGQKPQAKQAYQKALDLKPDYQNVKEDLERITKSILEQPAK